MRKSRLSLSLLLTGVFGVGLFTANTNAKANMNFDPSDKSTMKFMQKLSKTNGKLAMIMQDTNVTSQSSNQFVTSKNVQGVSLENNQQITIPINTSIKYLGQYKDGDLISTSDNKILSVNNFKNNVYSNDTYKFSKSAKDKLKNLSKKWHKTLNKDEVKAVGHYTSDGYQDVNKYLRNPGNKTSDKVKKEANNITTATSKFNSPDNLTLYRGISEEGLKASLNNQPLIVGAKYFDKGFSSTSLSRSIGEGFGNVLLKINIPLGNHGAYIAPFSKHKNEQEFLLNPGTKMIVTNIENKKVTLSGQLVNIKNEKSKKQASFNNAKNLKIVTLNLMNE
ncbi:ADP-ribosyltransferase [Apilactobacillus ozensis]|uniref:ADP-ribosyltransferase n=1 Tax=Apilactobacillus ozensis TaxID=866801 RepID=UPI00200B10CA|nr:ADP-ribosyltransferase [Apilactobacillus ozensis]MCK8606867.1 ADP-ribosyltransferase [Apilactobacillus ozensis]